MKDFKPGENNPIDELFKKQLSEHKMPVPESVWQDIQARQKKPVRGRYLMRAAAITVVMALSSWLYFLQMPQQNRPAGDGQQNSPELKPAVLQPNWQPEGEQAVAHQNTPTKNKDRPETEPKKEEKQKEKNKKNRKMPILHQPSSNTPIFVNNELKPADEKALQAEYEDQKLEQLQFSGLDESKIPGNTRYSIVVQLPDVNSYYGPDTAKQNGEEFKDRVWAYASSQFERLMAGEKPQLPKTGKELAFKLPKFFN